MLKGTWPLELLDDPARQPRVVHSALDFLREVLVGDHLQEFVVLPNGIELLDLREEDCLPSDLRSCLHDCASTEQFLRRLRDNDEALERYKATVEYINGRNERIQTSILPRERRNLRGRINKALKMVEDGEVDPSLLYVCEMRLQEQVPHPIGGERVKTVCLRDVKDVLGPYAAWTLYWDRHDEGFFVGSAPSGKGVHIDQVLWSNIGKNWRGYKLIAAWPKGEISDRVAKEFDDVLFHPPLTSKDVKALHEAAKVVLVRPGDVYLFSGGIAHTVLCVGDDLCISSYESIVTAVPRHVELFLGTSDVNGPYQLHDGMPLDELRDIWDEVADQFEEAADQLEDTEGQGPCALPLSPKATSAMWKVLQEGLHGDDAFQSKLRDTVRQSLSMCLRHNKYLRKVMPQCVLDSEIAAGFAGELVSGRRGGTDSETSASGGDRGAAGDSRERSRSRSRSRSQSAAALALPPLEFRVAQ